MNLNEARVYAALLRFDRAGVSDLVRLTGIHRPNLYVILNRLARQGLVSSNAGRLKLFSAAPPEEVLGRAMESTQKLLRTQEESIKVLQQAYARRKAGKRPSPFMEIHRSAADEPSVGYWERIRQINKATSELLILRVPHPRVLPQDKLELARTRVNEAEIAALRRGVRCRSVVRADALADPWERGHARRLIEAGEEARVADRLPGAFLVIDRRTVWFRPSSIDEKDIVYKVNDTFTGEVFARAFESCWREGEDATVVLDRLEKNGAGPGRCKTTASREFRGRRPRKAAPGVRKEGVSLAFRRTMNKDTGPENSTGSKKEVI